MQSSSTVVVAWGLLLGGLCCCVTAAAIDCPSDVIRLACTKVPTSITLQVGKSYELGPGVFLLNETVEVPAGALCVAGQDRVGAPAGVTRLLSPEGAKQLHFTQYGGTLKINNLQLQGRAGSGGGGGVVIKQSKDGTDDNQPATFIARLVTFK
ncbi:hypothetical protein COO60DRAFT_885635 [Scenedesmus sp. NREL 46B-D3]|nr:hypothetical protein COO60DRAFT_885635 [Scenedesmus sp. NREL 46B-D3]